MQVQIVGKLDKAHAEALKRRVQDDILRAVGPAAHKLSVTVTVSEEGGVQIGLDGPDDLVKRVQAALTP